MDSVLKYKGYKGTVAYSLQDKVLHGEIIDIKCLVTYEARDMNELRKAFEEAVDDYLDFCKERGIEPERPREND